jgi:hypothetical protein
VDETVLSTAESRRQQNFWQLVVMGAEVLCAVVSWMVSFAFCGFVFLQVKSDGVVMLIAGFHGAWCWMVSCS